MDFRSLPGAAYAWLRITRCGWLIVMLLLGFLLRENYPFSNFPMFSAFSSRADFIYVAAANGSAIETLQFGISGSGLTKIFDRYQMVERRHFAGVRHGRAELAEAAAGQLLLGYLDGLTTHRPEEKKLLTGLRVEHATIRQQRNALLLETRTIAQHP